MRVTGERVFRISLSRYIYGEKVLRSALIGVIRDMDFLAGVAQ